MTELCGDQLMMDWNIQGEGGINDLTYDLYDFSSVLVSSSVFSKH